MVLRTLITYSGRVPMIKFRKGGPLGAPAAGPAPTAHSSTATTANAPPAPSAPPAAPVQSEPQVKDPLP